MSAAAVPAEVGAARVVTRRAARGARAAAAAGGAVRRAARMTVAGARHAVQAVVVMAVAVRARARPCGSPDTRRADVAEPRETLSQCKPET
jgi:hypothetical protein